MNSLRAEALVCIKNDRQLFGPLTFSVPAGAILYVRGPNGAGKTSLLRILAGIAQTTEGGVYFNDQNIARHSLYSSELNYIGHISANNLRLSALENLNAWCALHQVSPIPDLYGLLAKLGLTGLEDLPVVQLSAGQQRRVALARLWLKPSAVWILDEPYTALDVEAIKLLEEYIAQHAAQGGIVVMTSHQPPSAKLDVNQLTLEYQW